MLYVFLSILIITGVRLSSCGLIQLLKESPTVAITPVSANEEIVRNVIALLKTSHKENYYTVREICRNLGLELNMVEHNPSPGCTGEYGYLLSTNKQSILKKIWVKPGVDAIDVRSHQLNNVQLYSCALTLKVKKAFKKHSQSFIIAGNSIPVANKKNAFFILYGVHSGVAALMDVVYYNGISIEYSTARATILFPSFPKRASFTSGKTEENGQIIFNQSDSSAGDENQRGGKKKAPSKFSMVKSMVSHKMKIQDLENKSNDSKSAKNAKLDGKDLDYDPASQSLKGKTNIEFPYAACNNGSLIANKNKTNNTTRTESFENPSKNKSQINILEVSKSENANSAGNEIPDQSVKTEEIIFNTDNQGVDDLVTNLSAEIQEIEELREHFGSLASKASKHYPREIKLRESNGPNEVIRKELKEQRLSANRTHEFEQKESDGRGLSENLTREFKQKESDGQTLSANRTHEFKQKESDGQTLSANLTHEFKHKESDGQTLSANLTHEFKHKESDGQTLSANLTHELKLKESGGLRSLSLPHEIKQKQSKDQTNSSTLKELFSVPSPAHKHPMLSRSRSLKENIKKFAHMR